MAKTPRKPEWLFFTAVSLLFLWQFFLWQCSGLRAQDRDYSVLRINEVISNNNSTAPADSTGRHVDMVELFNAGNETLPLRTTNLSKNLGLSDTAEQPLESELFRFQDGVANIPAKGFLVVFLAKRPDEGLNCEIFADFKLANEGTEPITLWGPAGGADGKTRPIIDQVWLPPLDPDVSFGRFPDGAGPAKVPVMQTFDFFHFNPPGTSSFGACGAACNLASPVCKGAPNSPGGNLAPKVKRLTHSGNHPAAGEAVLFTVRVDDDQEPTPPNIARALLRYSVSGVAQPDIPLTYDAETGVLTAKDEVPSRPLERWTLWKGAIPGQPAGSRVDFTFFVEGAQTLSGTDPSVLCKGSIGPCDDLGLPGPNCEKEPAPSLKYVPCEVPFHYLVGYEPPEPLRSLVINEVMADQTEVLEDPTEALNICKAGNPTCKFDDFIEIHNVSTEPVDVAGLWLSDRPFHPRGWQFPPGATLGPKEYLIVWTDGDGGRCPRPPHQSSDGQDCPDPTDVAKEFYHTNFALETEGDQVYLFDREDPAHPESSLGVIHGVEFGSQEANVSWSLIPDGDRSGMFIKTPRGSPGARNPSVGPRFRRGDALGDCNADITDAIFILRFLFQGGTAPRCPDAADVDDTGIVNITDPINLLQFLFLGGPAPRLPGPAQPGPDPTTDDLGACEEATC